VVRNLVSFTSLLLAEWNIEFGNDSSVGSLLIAVALEESDVRTKEISFSIDYHFDYLEVVEW
jgi:hypothetical protein